LGETAVVFLVLVAFEVGPGTLFFTSPSSESDDSESELELDSPSDLEEGGEGFDAGVLTLDLTVAFDLGGEITFAPECFLLLGLGFRELVSESASEDEQVS